MWEKHQIDNLKDSIIVYRIYTMLIRQEDSNANLCSRYASPVYNLCWKFSSIFPCWWVSRSIEHVLALSDPRLGQLGCSHINFEKYWRAKSNLPCDSRCKATSPDSQLEESQAEGFRIAGIIWECSTSGILPWSVTAIVLGEDERHSKASSLKWAIKS